MANEVRLLNVCRTLATGTTQSFADQFDGVAMSANWSNGNWGLGGRTDLGLPLVSGGVAYSYLDNQLRTAKLSSRSMATTAYRDVSISWFGQTGSIAYVMLDMADGSPNPLTGGYMFIAVNHLDGTAQIQLTLNGNVVKNFVYPKPPPYGSGGGLNWILRISVDGANVVRCYWFRAENPSFVYQPASYTAAGGQVGFALANTAIGIVTRATWFKTTYSTAVGQLPPSTLVMSKNGLLYRESTNGNMIQVDTALTLASDRWLSSVPRKDKLYIADYKLRTQNTSGAATTSTASPGVLTDADADFVTDGVSVLDDMLVITGGTWATGSGLGGYLITAVTATTITVDRVFAANIVGAVPAAAGTGVSYRVGRAPKVFDSTAMTLTRLTPTTGSVPITPTIVTLFWDRLFWTGNPFDPATGVFSAVGEPLDYQLFRGDAKGAVAYDADTQELGDHITAAIPHENDYLVIGGKRSSFVMRGDPYVNPVPDMMSRELGLLFQGAHCYTPEQAIVAMTQHGIYVFAPEQSNMPQKVSRDRLPEELTNINTDLVDVLLVYDQAREGINIFVTPKDPGPTAHWFFAWRTKSFHRDSYPPDMEPTAVTTHALGGQGSPMVILGCRDGYLRGFADDRPDDDGTNFESFVLIGPIPLGGGGYYDGILSEVIGQLAVDSGVVTLAIQVGDSIESAFNAAPCDAIVLRAGKNLTHMPRLRGNACFLRLSSTGGTAWAMEQMSIVRERLGKQRLL